MINAELHDLATDNQHIALGSYTAFLQWILKQLLSLTKAKIVWLSTTPAPTNPPTALFSERTQSAVIAYNKAADTVVDDAREITGSARIEPTCNLFEAVCGVCAPASASASDLASASAPTDKCAYSTCPLQEPGGIHYEAAGWDLLGKTVHACLSRVQL